MSCKNLPTFLEFCPVKLLNGISNSNTSLSAKEYCDDTRYGCSWNNNYTETGILKPTQKGTTCTNVDTNRCTQVMYEADLWLTK